MQLLFPLDTSCILWFEATCLSLYLSTDSSCGLRESLAVGTLILSVAASVHLPASLWGQSLPWGHCVCGLRPGRELAPEWGQEMLCCWGAVCQEEEKVCNYLDYWASGRVQGQPSLAAGLCGLRI